MVVLVLGSGGREHALAWKIAQSSLLSKLYIAPGNAGTLELGENVSIDPENFQLVAKFALENKVEIIVVGPEGPLVNGINDYFSNDPTLSSITVIGPKKEGAILEGSKAFSKKLEKHPIWKEIVKTNSDITPYSLRHRFAHQCHTGSRYPISIKDAAEAMGHTVDVHNGSYASYTNEMSVERAFDLHNKERVTV